MNEQKTKKERMIERWFAVLAERRKGTKWKDMEAKFGVDSGSLARMARKAENIERERNGLAPRVPRSGKKTRVFTICENPRFYCLEKVYWDGQSKMECECGSPRHPIHSEKGIELKEKRKHCRTAQSAGDIRSTERPALCSVFADAVILDPINTKKFNL